MKRIRLILIEDNRLLREGISAMLKKASDINVIAAIDDSQFDYKEIGELRPDILLVDIGLVKFNSLDLIRKIKEIYLDLKIVVMDFISINEDIIKYIEAGVSGFLLKDATVEEFTKTIRLVISGEKVLPSKLTGSLFSQIMDFALDELGSTNIAQSIKMTNREIEIVGLVSMGYSNKEIAEKLAISLYTVKSHVHNILEKMALNTRVQIAINARNIIHPPSPKK
ncbi:MAG: response regulator transcription factor [Ignavibacteria bacterium]